MSWRERGEGGGVKRRDKGGGGSGREGGRDESEEVNER